MADLTALATYLKSEGTTLVLNTTDSNLGNDFQAFVGTMHTKTMTITVDTNGVVLQNNVLTISGTCATSWPVQGLYQLTASLTSVTITINGTLAANTFQAVFQGTMPISSTSVPIILTSLPLDANPWQLTLAQNASNISPLQLILLGNNDGALPFDLPTGLDFLNTQLVVDANNYAIVFYPDTTYEPYINLILHAPSATWQPLPSVFSFNGLDIVSFIKTNSLSIKLIGHINVGNIAMDVAIGVEGGSSWSVYINPTPPQQAFPGLDALANWVGGSSLATSVSGGFTSVNLPTTGFDAAISALSASVNMSTNTLNYFNIKSLLSIGILQFDVVVVFPDISINGSLHNPAGVKVSDMLASMSLPTDAVPAALTIDTADFTADLKNSYYSTSIVVDNVWAVGPISLQQIGLSIYYSPYNGLAGLFSGQFAINTTLTVFLEAEYIDTTTGWEFTGGIPTDTTVALGDILTHLASDFGINSIPAPMQSLVLNGLLFSYTTGTNTFTYTCNGTFKVDDVDVNIGFTTSIQQTQGNTTGGGVVGTKGYTAFFGGTISLGNLEFNLVFDTDVSSNTFIATFINNSAGSIVLQNLVASVSSTLAQTIPPSLSIDLKQAKFVFYEDTAKQFAFGLDLGTSLNLSDIPIISGKLPANVTLILDDLQVLYCSSAFTQAQTSTINALLPTSISPLVSTGPPAGLQLSANLNVGTELLNLYLDIESSAASTNSNTPNGGGTANQPVASAAPSSITWFTIDKQFGPVFFQSIGVSFQSGVLSFSFNTSVTIGPLSIALEGLTFGSPINTFAPVFNLYGMGIGYSSPPLSIQGAILRVPQDPAHPNIQLQFDGSLIVQAADWGLSAIASYAQLTNGLPSMFIFLDMNEVLGGPPYFIVEGVMGGFGFNRSLVMPAPDEVLNFPLLAINAPQTGSVYDQAMNTLFILEGSNNTTKPWITPKEGDYWLAAGLVFSSFEIVQGNLLLVARFGQELQFALLGLAYFSLPKGVPVNDAFVFVEMQMEAVLKPGEGVLNVGGSLTTSSYVLTKDCHLTGGFAFYMWFGSNPYAGQFVMTVGGYHPAFIVPSYYPNVARLGFNWQVSGDVLVKGDSYFALTPSCGMAGGGLEVLYHSGPIKAWFTAQANMLVTWHPFSFIADISVDIGASVRINLLVCHKTISVSLGASLTLWGPPLGGKVRVHIVIVTVTIHFGSDSADYKDKLALEWDDSTKEGISLTGFNKLLPAPNNICKHVINSGLTKTLGKDISNPAQPIIFNNNPPPSPTDTVEKIWVVRAGTFSFTSQSVIPSNNFTYGNSSSYAVNTTTPNVVAIRPMFIPSITSMHNVQIFKEQDNTSTLIAFDEWSVTPVYANVASSLWGQPLKNGNEYVQAPSLPSSDTEPNQIIGYQIQGPSPVLGATFGVLPLSDLAEDDIANGTNPLSINPSATTDYEPMITDPSNPNTPPATTVKDIENIAAVSTLRNNIYQVLSSHQFYNGSNDSMVQMAATAGDLFTVEPLELAVNL